MANPTTNYGFVLPTSSDLVTDLPADFDVALQGVDTRLKALNPETTLGDIAYASATANTNTRLGIGSTGQVLTVAGGVPTWAGASIGGMTLLSTTTLSTTTTTVNITPTGYTYLYFTISKMGFTGGATPLLTRLNGTTSANYCFNNRANDNTFSKGSSQTAISSVNNYENSDSQWVEGFIALPNSANKRPSVQMLYYYNVSANQGFGQSWGANEAVSAAITSITFLSSNGTSTFVNSPQLLIYGVK